MKILTGEKIVVMKWGDFKRILSVVPDSVIDYMLCFDPGDLDREEIKNFTKDEKIDRLYHELSEYGI